jgi:hypothetical protein
MKCDKTVGFQFDDEDEEFEVHVISYSGPTPDTRDDPGDSGEIDFDDIVDVLRDGKQHSHIKFGEFVDRYAAYHSLDRSKADSKIYDYCFEDVSLQFADDFDDGYDGPDNWKDMD